MKCIFCSINPGRLIFENQLAFCVMDAYPVSTGHCLVIPKRHVCHLSDIRAEEMTAIWDLIRSACRMLETEYRPDGYNIGVNSGRAGGQTIPHLHVHLIPRYTGDHPDPTGGIRHVIPDRANYLNTAAPAREPGFLSILLKIQTLLAEQALTPLNSGMEICRILHASVPYYDWVGIYRVDDTIPDDTTGWLQLGPYYGDPTEHARIPFGRGVCGQVAISRQPRIVQDVHGESNYIACSLSVQSEIVVPVIWKGSLMGVIDIDSHSPAPFTQDDLLFLQSVAMIVGGIPQIFSDHEGSLRAFP